MKPPTSSFQTTSLSIRGFNKSLRGLGIGHMPHLTRQNSTNFVAQRYRTLKERGYDIFLNITRREDYTRYREFRRDDFAVIFFFFFMVIITVFWGFGNASLFLYFRHDDTVDAVGLVGLIITLLGNVCAGWLLFLWHYCHKFHQESLFYKLLTPHVSKLEGIFLVCAPIGPGFNLLASSMHPCTKKFETFFAPSSRLCNPEYDVNALPQYITLLVFIATEISQCMVKCSQFRMVFISWFMSLFFISFAMILNGNYNSVLFPIFTVFYGFMIYEIERRELDFFFKLKELFQAEESLTQKEFESKKQLYQTQTLNRIISNVSHDLISPLQALEMGLETVLRLIHSGKQRLQSRLRSEPHGSNVHLINVLHNAGNMEEDIMALDSCLELSLSMRDTLLFMSTIIYRCLDASTASGGSILIPHCEHFDIQESINRVCLCITDMEKRIPLVVSPWPAGVEPTLKTDKRWLEGNLHCIITNALKFSTNEKLPVEVKIKLFNIADFKAGSNSPEKPVSPAPAPAAAADGGLFSGPTIYMLCIEVTDSGKEISAEVREKLFQAPEQVGRFDRGGSGMGLFALAKRVEALGGAFGSRARADKKCSGSVIWFTIPVTTVDLSRKPKAVRSTLGGKSQPPAGLDRNNNTGNMSFRRSDKDQSVPENKFIAKMPIPPAYPPPSGPLSPPLNPMAQGQVQAPGQAGMQQMIPIGPVLPMTAPVPVAAGAAAGAGAGARGGIKQPSPDIDNSDKLVSVRHITRPASKLHLEIGLNTSRSASGDAQHSAESKLSEDAGEVNLQNLHVLVVDDAMTIMRITKMCLEKEGHVVDQAHNGQVALDKMKETLYDLVLMDIQMPVMGGIESTKHIRSYESAMEGPPSRCGKHQFIVGMSANGDAETRTETIEIGMDSFIPKPFSIFRMMKVLEELPGFRRVSVPLGSSRHLVHKVIDKHAADQASDRRLPERTPEKTPERPLERSLDRPPVAPAPAVAPVTAAAASDGVPRMQSKSSSQRSDHSAAALAPATASAIPQNSRREPPAPVTAVGSVAEQPQASPQIQSARSGGSSTSSRQKQMSHRSEENVSWVEDHRYDDDDRSIRSNNSNNSHGNRSLDNNHGNNVPAGYAAAANGKVNVSSPRFSTQPQPASPHSQRSQQSTVRNVSAANAGNTMNTLNTVNRFQLTFKTDEEGDSGDEEFGITFDL
jgi:CheY-like chemotaxis protein/signal transduction histidine kinase